VPVDLTLAGFDSTKDSEGYHFDPVLAERPIQFCENFCTHTDGEWDTDNIILEEWQKTLLRILFGWVNDKGLRRFRTLFLYVPRKNAKTTLASVILLYMFFCEKKVGAQFYATAAKKDNASLLFDSAAGMIEQDSNLAEKVKILHHNKIFSFKKDRRTFLKVLPADAKKEHGRNAYCVVIDELHAQPDRELYSVMKTSMGSRKQPLLLLLTTADYFQESLCNNQLNYAESVRDGAISDNRYFPVIYAATKEDDWHDPEVWKKVNPNYGVSVLADSFINDFTEAKNDPSFENEFKRLHLNIQTEQLDSWLQMDEWNACTKTYEEKDLLKKWFYGGLDIADINDLTAYAKYFPEIHALKVDFFIPEERVRLKIKQFEPYRRWIDEGWITLLPGKSTNPKHVREFIMQEKDKYRLQSLAFDPHQAQQISNELGDYGIQMIKFNQNWVSYTEPCNHFNRLIKEGLLRHNNNPVLKWMAGNVAVQKGNNGQMYPVKKGSFGKIDGIMAAIMATGLTILDANRISIYASMKKEPCIL